MGISRTRTLRVSDEVWIAAALLHHEQPKHDDFTVAEIVERAKEEALAGDLRPGVYVHAIQHCVSNRPANPGRYRMLVETGRNRRRLYRPGDPFDPSREGARHLPERNDLPPKYRHLLDWYEATYAKKGRRRAEEDPLLELRGSGKATWASEPADQYVTRLREGWQ